MGQWEIIRLREKQTISRKEEQHTMGDGTARQKSGSTNNQKAESQYWQRHFFIKVRQKVRVQEESDKHENTATVILKFSPIITYQSVFTAEQATATSLNTMKLSPPKLAFTLRLQVQGLCF